MMKVRDVGKFIREQRGAVGMSLRNLAKAAGVSNPYLSQIERGLRRPSADILNAIAKALRISAETLYVKAGILDDRKAAQDVQAAILADRSPQADEPEGDLGRDAPTGREGGAGRLTWPSPGSPPTSRHQPDEGGDTDGSVEEGSVRGAGHRRAGRPEGPRAVRQGLHVRAQGPPERRRAGVRRPGR